MRVIDFETVRSQKLGRVSLMADKIDTEVFKNFDLLKSLRIEHRDLDQTIMHLSHDPTLDQLELKRLKRKKLVLKDRITALESELIPDMNA